jgi:hypothetical protein
MSFSVDLNRAAQNIGRGLDETRRAVIIELYGSVIGDTPVDTGRARGNWQTTVGAPKDGEIEKRTMASARAEVAANLGQLGDTVYMTNNLPYIEFLEEGSSKQAPIGMVRRNFLRIAALLKRKATGRFQKHLPKS